MFQYRLCEKAKTSNFVCKKLIGPSGSNTMNRILTVWKDGAMELVPIIFQFSNVGKAMI